MTQNNIPAVEVSTIISDLNKYFANIVNNKDRYSRGIPPIISTIVELGAENVFYMHQNYRGLYEDDDCNFYYWDNVNGRVISNFWTTAAACPDFKLYTDKVLTFSQAKEYGLVNMDLIKKHNIENALKQVANTDKANHRGMMLEHTPMIKVERGRKWRGVGYYIGEVEIQKSRYYPATIEARVLSLEDFQIHYCNPNYIKLVERDELVAGYIQWATETINNVVKDNSYFSFFDMKGVTWKIIREDFSFESYVKKHKNPYIEHLINTAYDPRAEEEKRILAEKRAQEYTGILEWVKTKTDKNTNSEQVALATKILYKKF